MIGEIIFVGIFIGIIGYLVYIASFSAQRSTRVYISNE
jgi:hypothetical protein